MIEEKAFVEHAKFGGNRYGTSKRTIGELTASGRVVLLDIEMEVCPLFLFHIFRLGKLRISLRDAELKCILGLLG